MNHNKYFLKFFLIICLLVGGILHAQEKPRIGVLRFSSMVDDVSWWRSSVASEIQEMLTSQMQESPLAKGPNAKVFEAIKSDRSDIFDKQEDIHFVSQNENSLADAFSRVEGFSALIGVTLTAYDKVSGNITATIMYYDLGQRLFGFQSALSQVKSPTQEALLRLTAAIGERLTDLIPLK